MLLSGKKVAPYWYYTVTVECPLCGSLDVYRERRYTPKPDNPEERFKYQQEWDYCEY